MKQIIILSFLVIILISSAYAQTCEGEITIFVKFRDHNVQSELGLHKFPNLVEGDPFQIDKIIINNLADCTGPKFKLNFKLKKLNGDQMNFCDFPLIINPIEAQTGNIITFSGSIKDEAHGVQRTWLGYEDLYGNKYKWCGRILIIPGTWDFEKNIELIDTDSNFKFLLGILDQNDNFQHTGFKVYSKNEIQLVSDTSQLVTLTAVLTWLTIVIAILALIQIISSYEKIITIYKKINQKIKKPQKPLKPKN